MKWLTKCTAGPAFDVRGALIPALSPATNICLGLPCTPDCMLTFTVCIQASIAQLQAEQKAAQEGKQQLQQTASAYTAEIQELQRQLQSAQQQQPPEVSYPVWIPAATACIKVNESLPAAHKGFIWQSHAASNVSSLSICIIAPALPWGLPAACPWSVARICQVLQEIAATLISSGPFHLHAHHRAKEALLQASTSQLPETLPAGDGAEGPSSPTPHSGQPEAAPQLASQGSVAKIRWECTCCSVPACCWYNCSVLSARHSS